MIETKRYQKIQIDKLETTISKLEKLEDKPQSEFNLRESIYYLRDNLKSALKKGYSYQDLSNILAEQEILVSAATLKQHLNDIEQKSASPRKKNKSTSKIASPSFASDNSQESAQDSSNQATNQSHKVGSENSSNSTAKAEVKSSNRIEKKPAKNSSALDKNVDERPAVLSGSHKDLSHEFNQY